MIACWLQWGRAFSDAEITPEYYITAGRVQLQWGRAFSDAEIGVQSLKSSSFHLLQWGRAFSDAEISLGNSIVPQVAYASMGPRLFRRGNDSDGGAAQVIESGFNGAAPFQTRKWLRSPFFMSPDSACFNGAAPFQTRKSYGNLQSVTSVK